MRLIRYVEIGSVVANSHRPGATSVPTALPATCHPGGAVTASVIRRLQVGLVEAGEHPLRVVQERLRVQVDRPVLRVDEPVQPLAGVGEAHAAPHHQLVLLGQIDQRQPVAVEPGHLDRDPVQPDLVQPVRLDLHERRLPRPAAGEPDRGGGAEAVRFGARACRAPMSGGVGQVQVDAVLPHRDQLGARDRLGAGQTGHAPSLRGRHRRDDRHSARDRIELSSWSCGSVPTSVGGAPEGGHPDSRTHTTRPPRLGGRFRVYGRARRGRLPPQ